jgi:hypothetical protein
MTCWKKGEKNKNEKIRDRKKKVGEKHQTAAGFSGLSKTFL